MSSFVSEKKSGSEESGDEGNGDERSGDDESGFTKNVYGDSDNKDNSYRDNAYNDNRHNENAYNDDNYHNNEKNDVNSGSDNNTLQTTRTNNHTRNRIHQDHPSYHNNKSIIDREKNPTPRYGYQAFLHTPSIPKDFETSPPDETPHSFWTWLRSLFAQPIRSSAGSFAIGGLPRSLRHLPLLLFALRRGSLLGDGFRGEELIQLRRLRLAAASLQDSLRILLPRVIVALERNAPPLTRINSMPICAPPRDETPGERRLGDETPGLTYTASMPQLAIHAMTQATSPRSEMIGCEKNEEIVEETESLSSSESNSEATERSFSVTGFLPEEGGGTPFYLESRLVTHLATRPLPEFHMVPAETLALLSNAVVVVDTLREIFIWVGSQHGSIENDPVYGGCVSLALSLVQHRSPPSAIRVVFENSSSARFVLCCLIPSHKDPLEMAAKTISPLQTLSPQALRDHVSKFFYTDDMSFREYMTKLYHFG